MNALPIDTLLPELVSALRTAPSLVLQAQPGAGKTTRVPTALLEAGIARDKEIVVLQPRRLATRLAALRVASERNERAGDTIGYQVRFEDVTSAKTRVRFVTEGILTRQMVSDPTLARVGAIVLDEFHERHLASDLALALIRRLQLSSRPDLKLVVMSATLDSAALAEWLNQAPSFSSEGRQFPIEIEHADRDDDRHLDQQVLGALKRLVSQELDGHVLVFLPGASEIRRTQDACDEFARRHDLELHVLHGELPPTEQDKALKPSKRRKVILATNVAETSVTIDGVAAVIDSGLARIAAHSPWTGLPTLKVAKVARASAIQRAGRAGRTRAGRCIRLFTKNDFDGRPFSETPEIRRLDFTESALALHAMGVSDLSTFGFFEAPAKASLDSAEDTLHMVGAVDANGRLTDVGRRLAQMPLHPRLSRVVVECDRAGFGADGAAVAALLGERDIRLETRRFHDTAAHARRESGESDVLNLYERYREAEAMGAKSANVDAVGFRNAERSAEQLKRHISKTAGKHDDAKRDEAVLRSIVAAFPDRIAKRRKPNAPELLLSGGGTATLDTTSVVHDAELMVAVDAEERRGTVWVRLASAVQPEWLLETSSGLLSDSDALAWNRELQRVDRLVRMTYGALTLEEWRQIASPSEAVSALLAEEAASAPLREFIEPDAMSAWQCRIEVLRAGFPEAGFPEPTEAFIKTKLKEMCEGLRSFNELREAGLLNVLNAGLTGNQARLLQTQTPERIQLPSGRSVQVHYEPARPPWIESRLQDFFGMTKGPAIGAMPLVLHLLAPNQRAVQVTTDLSGFWDRHYPAIRKELMRQYPKHSWPEDPRTATPPAPRPPRRH